MADDLRVDARNDTRIGLCRGKLVCGVPRAPEAGGPGELGRSGARNMGSRNAHPRFRGTGSCAAEAFAPNVEQIESSDPASPDQEPGEPSSEEGAPAEHSPEEYAPVKPNPEASDPSEAGKRVLDAAPEFQGITIWIELRSTNSTLWIGDASRSGGGRPRRLRVALRCQSHRLPGLAAHLQSVGRRRPGLCLPNVHRRVDRAALISQVVDDRPLNRASSSTSSIHRISPPPRPLGIVSHANIQER